MRKLNEVLDKIREGKGLSRRELAEKMGRGVSSEALNKHFENDSADSWKIARMCEILGLPTMPSDWFLPGRHSDGE